MATRKINQPISWEEQERMDRAIGKLIARRLERERSKQRIKHFIEDVLGVASLFLIGYGLISFWPLLTELPQ